MAAAVSYLDLFQGWSMFAPDAPTTDFNIVVDAVTIDGRHVDPFNEAVNPRYPAPGKRVPPSMGPSWLSIPVWTGGISSPIGRPRHRIPILRER